MRTPLCQRLEIELPIFAFSHCRDVVAEVSRAGGLGVLGALGFSPEELEGELVWLDGHVGDRPYGVDVVIPARSEGPPDTDAAELEARLRASIPERHRKFVHDLLREHGVPELPEGERPRESLGWSPGAAAAQIDVALRHPKLRLVANALGTPPSDVVRGIQREGRLVAALAGSVRHALAHAEAGVDVVIAQGHEAGAHTGEVGSIVLWPQVIDAVAPIPVLAAGGIGTGRQVAAALALGAQGVWTGSLWLLVSEADLQPAQQESYLRAGSEDTVRSRSFTGTPNRMLRNAWTDAWEAKDAPEPLGMPLQYMATAEAVERTARYASRGQAVAFNAGGQILGMLNEVRSTRAVVHELVSEYVDAVDRLVRLAPEEA